MRTRRQLLGLFLSGLVPVLAAVGGDAPAMQADLEQQAHNAGIIRMTAYRAWRDFWAGDRPQQLDQAKAEYLDKQFHEASADEIQAARRDLDAALGDDAGLGRILNESERQLTNIIAAIARKYGRDLQQLEATVKALHVIDPEIGRLQERLAQLKERRSALWPMEPDAETSMRFRVVAGQIKEAEGLLQELVYQQDRIRRQAVPHGTPLPTTAELETELARRRRPLQKIVSYRLDVQLWQLSRTEVNDFPEIAMVRGEVLLSTRASEQPARPGMKLEYYSRVTTGADGCVLIRRQFGGLLELGPNSRVVPLDASLFAFDCRRGTIRVLGKAISRDQGQSLGVTGDAILRHDSETQRFQPLILTGRLEYNRPVAVTEQPLLVDPATHKGTPIAEVDRESLEQETHGLNPLPIRLLLSP